MKEPSHWSGRTGFIPVMGVLLAITVILTVRAMLRPVYLDADGHTVGKVRFDVDLRLDLNSAGAAQMQSLPQIGPALAQRIVEDRELNGPYASLEDVQRVPGLGPRTVERIRAYAVCGEK